MHLNLRRYQLVVWPHPRSWRIRRWGQWPTETKFPVYRWVVRIGPLELRRWALLVVLLVAAPVAAAQNVLTWVDNSAGEVEFDIERGLAPTVADCQVDGVAFEPWATVGQNVTTYTDDAVTPGLTYCYRVNAADAAGDVSAYSNVAGRTVPLPTRCHGRGHRRC